MCLNISNSCFIINLGLGKEIDMEREESSGTRDRILEAAGESFAECGFRGATVRKICERAQVNISAIKYHFGGKEKLYSEVLRYWHDFAIKKYPPLLGANEEAPAEIRLRAFIRSLLFRLLDKGKPAWFGKLMAREMAEPTKAFDRMVKEVMRPLNKLLASILQSMAGHPLTEKEVLLCCTSIIGQCVYYYNARYIAQLFQHDMSDSEEIEKIADHILRFSLKGLEHYSETAGTRQEQAI
jgi:TetR/AcrR family transcriptional regulator, regulator of cefoperazone and chloramphenicol sensitivity